jgi:hypothetical protein
MFSSLPLLACMGLPQRSFCLGGHGGGRASASEYARMHASKQASMHAQRVGSWCGSCHRGNGRPRGSRDVRKRLTSLTHCRAQQVESYTMGASRCEPGHAMRMCAAIVIAVAVLLPDLAVGHLEYFCVSSVFSNSSQYCNKAVLWLGTCESSLLLPRNHLNRFLAPLHRHTGCRTSTTSA